MSSEHHTLRRLCIRVADDLPLPELVEVYNRRVELADFLDGLQHDRDDAPISIARLLGHEALSIREAVALVREHHAATA